MDDPFLYEHITFASPNHHQDRLSFNLFCQYPCLTINETRQDWQRGEGSLSVSLSCEQSVCPQGVFPACITLTVCSCNCHENGGIARFNEDFVLSVFGKIGQKRVLQAKKTLSRPNHYGYESLMPL